MSEKNLYAKQQKLSVTEFLVELPNFIAVTVTAVLTGSLITWMDFIDSLGNIINSACVVALSKKLKRNLRYEYNYGIGKVEAIASLLCEFLVILGLLSICIFSVIEILTPKQPSELILYAILLKIVNIGFDFYFLVKQRKLSKSGSRISESAYIATIQNLLFDVIAIISLFVCYVFRDYRIVWYFAPVVCLALSVYFFIDSIKRIKSAVAELTDKTLPEKEQLLILKALSSCNDGYSKLLSVNSHYIGGKVCIDLHIMFKPTTTYAEIEGFLGRVSKIIAAEIASSVVSITIVEPPKEQAIKEQEVEA